MKNLMLEIQKLFISIGKFHTYAEADAVKKYISTKFARTLLGILKSNSKW